MTPNNHYESLLLDTNGLRQGSVRMTWLGTAGMFITDGKTGILLRTVCHFSPW
ncbi:MAG: hypothetical protein ABFD63_07300 [Smithella sp.]